MPNPESKTGQSRGLVGERSRGGSRGSGYPDTDSVGGGNAAAGWPHQPPPCRVYRLPNGLLVAESPFPSPAVGVSLAVRCGPAFEDRRDLGLSHLLEHMLFRGIPAAPSSTRLARRLDAIGGDANAATSCDLTVIWHRLLPEHLAEGLALLYAMVTEPTISDLETERQIVLEELLEDRDERGRLVAIDQLSAQGLWPRHPYSNPILGTPRSLARFGESDLRRHLRRCYRPDAAALVITGAFAAPVAAAAIDATFARWRNPTDSPRPVDPPAPAPVAGPVVRRVYTPGRSQVAVRLSVAGAGCTEFACEREKAVWRLLDSGPSSPLRRVLQEEGGFCYQLGTDLDVCERASALHVDLTLNPDRVIEAVRELLGVLAARTRRIPRDERDWMVQQFAKERRFATSDLWDHATSQALRALSRHPRDLADDIAAVMALSPGDLVETARTMFHPQNFALTVVGPVSPRQADQLRSMLADFPDRRPR